MRQKTQKQKTYIVHKQAVRDMDLRTIKQVFSPVYLQMVFEGKYNIDKSILIDSIKTLLHIEVVSPCLYQDVISLLSRDFPKVKVISSNNHIKSQRACNGFYYKDTKPSRVKYLDIQLLRSCMYNSIVNEAGHSFISNIVFLLYTLVMILTVFSILQF